MTTTMPSDRVPSSPLAQPASTPAVSSRVATPRSSMLRVLPIPECAPPIISPGELYALSVDSGFIQGTLALSFLADPDDHLDEQLFGPQRTSARDLPEPSAWAAQMAQALVEVMAGARPAPQVIRWTSPEVYSAVARRHAVSARRGPVSGRRAVVRRVRICEPADGVVEACAVVIDNGRVRALAMRLTGLDRRWLVSALQVG